MRVSFVSKPSHTAAYVQLARGESVLVERGAMVMMDRNIDVAVGVGPGGVLKAGLRKMLGGESFFMGRYTALAENAWVLLAPPFPGDIDAVEVAPGAGLLVQSGSLLACGDGVEIDVKFAGVANIALGQGPTLLRANGSGALLIASYGGIEKVGLAAHQSVIVDTGHLVAVSDTCTLRAGILGNVATAEVTGEGIVAEVTGPGEVYVQTRAEKGTRDWLLPDRGHNEQR